MMSNSSFYASKVRMISWASKFPLAVRSPLLFFVPVNVLRAIVMHISGDPTLFNIDYALILVIPYFMVRRGTDRRYTTAVSITLFLIAVSFDAVGFFGRLYRWGPDFYDSYLMGLNDLPWFVIAPLLFMGVAVFSLFCVPLLGMRFEKADVLSATLICIVIGMCDIYIERSTRKDLDSEKNVLTSPTKFAFSNYMRAVVAGNSVRSLTEPTMDPIVRVTAPPQILSVSLESLGLPISKTGLAELVQQPLEELTKSYSITVDNNNFYGSTLQGEMRELCSLNVNGNPSNPKIARYFSDCLPRFLSSKGYSTWAFHGNGGEIYNRKNVYPLIGFRHAVFYNDMASLQNIHPCEKTPFRGVCDHDMYVRALSLFNGSRRFVHIMTLDTHLPVYPTTPSECTRSFGDNESLCGYSKAIMRSLHDLSNVILRSKEKPDLIFIYGDHAPPFFSASTRQFFDGKRVPFVMLNRKDEGRGR